MAAVFLALLAGAAVLLPAFAGIGRPRTYAMVGFVGLITGGVMLAATPTPEGFDPGGDSRRPLVSAAVGQSISAALFSAGAAGLLAAFAVGQKRPTDSSD